MTARIIDNPKFKPGKCLITNSTKGPFLDTGRDIRGYGRVYIALESNEWLLNKAGYLNAEDIADLKGDLEEALLRIKELQPKADEYDDIINTMMKYMPDVKPDIREVTKIEPRDPTDEEIAEWIHNYGIDHPVIKSAMPPEPGSTEEWNRLYRNQKPKAAPFEAKEEETPEPEEVVEASTTFTLNEEQVILDDILDNSVKEIEAFCEGKPEEFLFALGQREIARAEENERDPRKTLLSALGWTETEDTTEDDDDQLTLSL